MAKIYRTDRFKLMKEPMIANYTSVYNALKDYFGPDMVRSKLRNAQTLTLSRGVYLANDEIGRHFSNWSIDNKQDFLVFCDIILGTEIAYNLTNMNIK